MRRFNETMACGDERNKSSIEKEKKRRKEDS